jgi:hypothetical protein
VEARADDDGHVHDVRPRQGLTEPEKLRELSISKPSPVVDQHATCMREHTTESRNARLEKTQKELPF